MNFGFVNPAFLWGLLLAAVPVIIHLINKRRAVRHEFSAIYFVELSNKKLSAHLKLKQFLLLLLRCLLIALLALLMARPYTQPESLKLAGNGQKGPTAHVFVIDVSASMSALLDDKPLFNTARKEALRILAGFPESDSFGIVPAGVLAAEPFEMSFDRGAAIRYIEALEATPAGDDLPAALESADVMLQSASQENKSVIIIGDFTRVGYDVQALPWGNSDEQPETLLVDVRKGQAIDNLALTELRAERSYFTGSADWNIKISAVDYSDKNVSSLPVSVFINGENSANGFIDIAAGATAEKEFIQRFDSTGAVSIEARIQTDALASDNSRYLALDISETVRVLVVDGEPSDTTYRDEVFYLSRALDPGGLNRARLLPEVITPDRLTPAVLNEKDVVFLCHLAVMPADMGAALSEFVKSGGGIFISVGKNTDADSYNANVPALLPGELRYSIKAGEATADNQAGTTLHLAGLDYSHPILDIFNDENAASLYAARINEYYTYHPDPSREKETILKLSNNAPALVAMRYGKGMSMFYAGTIDRDWNDIAIQPGFLPLIQESALYLAGFSGESLSPGAVVGGNIEVALEKSVAPRQISTPSGRKLAFSVADNSAVFNGTDETGIYSTEMDGRSRLFAVNFDTRESDLRQEEASRIEAIFGKEAALSALSGTLPGQRDEKNNELTWLLLLIFLAELLIIRWLN